MGATCPYCNDTALHTGDVVAIDPTLESALRTSLTRLGKDRGLRVTVAGNSEDATLTVVAGPDSSDGRSPETTLQLPAVVSVRQAQRLLHNVCLQGIGQQGGVPASSAALTTPLAITRDMVLLPPTVTGQPQRLLFERPLHRDGLVWTGLVLSALVSAGAPILLIRVLGRSWIVEPFVARLDLPDWGLAALISTLISALIWVVIVLPIALIRRSWRRAKDRDLLSVPPSDQLPGWRPDPLAQSQQRWWNGLSWTGALQPRPRRGWSRLAPLVLLAFAGVLLAWEGSLGVLSTTTLETTVAPEPMSSATPTGYANLGAALPQVERALLDYGNATGSDPLADSPSAEAALLSLVAAKRTLDAALANASPAEQQSYGRFQQAFDAFVAARVGYVDDLRSCAGQGDTACQAQLRVRWQGPILDTVQPLSDAYREILQPATQS